MKFFIIRISIIGINLSFELLYQHKTFSHSLIHFEKEGNDRRHTHGTHTFVNISTSNDSDSISPKKDSTSIIMDEMNIRNSSRNLCQNILVHRFWLMFSDDTINLSANTKHETISGIILFWGNVHHRCSSDILLPHF